MRSLKTLNRITLVSYFALLAIHFLFLLVWFAFCLKHTYHRILTYRRYKQTSLFPLISSVKVLEKKRVLYNEETHIVKFVVLTFCVVIEIMNIFLFVGAVIFERYPGVPDNDTIVTHFKQTHLYCELQHSFLEFYFHPEYILIFNSNFIFVFLLWITISFLSRYLSLRYFNHGYLNTLKKYSWLFITQSLVILLCSNTYTFIFSFITCPVLLILNFILLFRDSLTLTQVLRINLHSLKYHGSKVLYKEQLRAYRFYRIFRIVYLFSTSVFVLCICCYYSYKFLDFFIEQFCIIEFLYGIEIPSFIIEYIHKHRDTIRALESVMFSLGGCLLVVYSSTMTLPFVAITLWPSVRRILKRLRARERDFRFNYSNTLPHLRH